MYCFFSIFCLEINFPAHLFSSPTFLFLPWGQQRSSLGWGRVLALVAEEALPWGGAGSCPEGRSGPPLGGAGFLPWGH